MNGRLEPPTRIMLRSTMGWTKPEWLPLAAGLFLTAGCASLKPIAYTGLASSPQLRVLPARSNKIPYGYSTSINWRRYYRVILEPVKIYRGPDAQFARVGPDDQAELARYMDEEFGQHLGAAFELVRSPDPSALRIRLTLTGAVPTKKILGSYSRFDLAGGPYNAFQGIRGKEGTLTGSVIYAVEIFDSASARLLYAQITKQFPNALNVGASFGALTAAKVGIRNGAKELVEALTRVERPRK